MNDIVRKIRLNYSYYFVE